MTCMNKQEINCPICSKQNTWQPENIFRPFCSERCKLIDLGEWASESRKIPAEPAVPKLLSENENSEEF